MKVIDYFGPRVAKTKLSHEDTKSLESICVPNNKPDNDRLVGHLKEEYNIFEILKSLPVYNNILKNANQYVTEIDGGYYTDILDQLPSNNFLEMTDAWYNKQTNLEHNPIHNHMKSADVVCVIYPKITLDNDVEYYVNHKGIPQKGQLYLTYGEREQNFFGKNNIIVQPEEGDMYIFPSTLYHYTNPVLGKSERFSISCNFSFTKLSKRAVEKYYEKT